QYGLDGQYDFMLDDQRDYEHQGQTDFAFSRDLRQISFGAEMGADYFYRPLLADTLNYVVARLDPWVGFKWKYIRLQAGPKVAMDRNASQFFFYPRMKLEINITNLLVPYMGLDGYYENHSYRFLSRENPYLVIQPDILPTNHRFIAYGGLRGRFTPLVAFDLAVSWEDAQNLYFFVTDTGGLVHHTFLPVYDNGSILKINGEVSLRQSENLSFILKGHYYQYQLDVLPAAWHRANWDANLTTRYAWRDKLFVQADLFLLGPYPVPEVDPAKGTIAQMDGLIDLSLGAEYRFTPFISAFCQVNNLLSDEYYLWQNYPMQKINFMGGITLIF
ncbi:MAG: hypothetical protein J7L89_05570, partial [Bacteroidales bacterium]|nr:hypothetical protein [Bacteroidales bacterium]